jgi:hypothetical protein
VRHQPSSLFACRRGGSIAGVVVSDDIDSQSESKGDIVIEHPTTVCCIPMREDDRVVCPINREIKKSDGCL